MIFRTSTDLAKQLAEAERVLKPVIDLAVPWKEGTVAAAHARGDTRDAATSTEPFVGLFRGAELLCGAFTWDVDVPAAYQVGAMLWEVWRDDADALCIAADSHYTTIQNANNMPIAEAKRLVGDLQERVERGCGDDEIKSALVLYRASKVDALFMLAMPYVTPRAGMPFRWSFLNNECIHSDPTGGDLKGRLPSVMMQLVQSRQRPMVSQLLDAVAARNGIDPVVAKTLRRSAMCKAIMSNNCSVFLPDGPVLNRLRECPENYKTFYSFADVRRANTERQAICKR